MIFRGKRAKILDFACIVRPHNFNRKIWYKKLGLYTEIYGSIAMAVMEGISSKDQ